jgi:anaphase-promoting complex subunit 2
MIRDIKEYDRLDGGIVFDDDRIRLEKEVTPKPQYETLEQLKYPGFNAKVLSRLFWPQLQDESFRIPEEIAAIQKAYEEGFEREQSNRKLTWLQSQGLAIVELALEDRLIRVEGVHTWQAAVIYAFHSENDGPTVEKTIQGLMDELEMSEPLVRSALKFWVNKLVLHESSPSTFRVLETLNQDDRLRSKNAAAGPATSSSVGDIVDSADAGMDGPGIHGPKEQMYWQFVQGMLKNGAKPLMQIAMTLKMLIAEGFPYGNEELKGFLDGKVSEGKLEVKGGKYKLKK